MQRRLAVNPFIMYAHSSWTSVSVEMAMQKQVEDHVALYSFVFLQAEIGITVFTCSQGPC